MRTTIMKSRQGDAISVLQLTDTHLFADEQGKQSFFHVKNLL